MSKATIPEPLVIDWPELHSQALGCGVEDRGIHDRYEAAEYGWQDGVDKCAERVPDEIFDREQMEVYAAAKVREALEWISVDERLPDKGLLVLVYSPPQPGDWPDSIRIEFDFIDPDSDDLLWHNHSEHYEHYSCVAKGGSDVEWTGPSERAPYTHWMHLPPPPQHDNE